MTNLAVQRCQQSQAHQSWHAMHPAVEGGVTMVPVEHAVSSDGHSSYKTGAAHHHQHNVTSCAPANDEARKTQSRHVLAAI